MTTFDHWLPEAKAAIDNFDGRHPLLDSRNKDYSRTVERSFINALRKALEYFGFQTHFAGRLDYSNEPIMAGAIELVWRTSPYALFMDTEKLMIDTLDDDAALAQSALHILWSDGLPARDKVKQAKTLLESSRPIAAALAEKILPRNNAYSREAELEGPIKREQPRKNMRYH